jgi:hypothetical protein
MFIVVYKDNKQVGYVSRYIHNYLEITPTINNAYNYGSSSGINFGECICDILNYTHIKYTFELKKE